MIKTLDHAKKVDLLKTQQIGRVVKNDDPRMLLRVKVYVKGVYEETDLEKLPWVFPKADAGLGGRPDSGNFVVPELNSEVSVFWPNSDVYHPYYEGRRLNSLTVPQEPFTTNYPESYGTIDSTKSWTRTDKKVGSTEYYSDILKKLIVFDGQGNLTLNIPASMIINIVKELQVNVGGSSTLTSGNNNVATCSNDFYLGAGKSFGATGGSGCLVDTAGPMHIHSGSTCSIDAPTIWENSGQFPGPASVPGEISALQSAMKVIQDQIKTLTDQAKKISDRMASVIDKIGK